RLERRAEGWRAKYLAEKHAGADDVRWIMVRPRGDIAGVRPPYRRAHHLPIAYRSEGDVAGNRLGERFGEIVGLSEFGVSDLVIGRFLCNRAVFYSQSGAIGLPSRGGQVEKQLARGGRSAADRRDGPWRRAAARSYALVGRQGGVGH